MCLQWGQCIVMLQMLHHLSHLYRNIEKIESTSWGWAVPSSGQAVASLSWDLLPCKRKLRSSSIQNRIEVVFHLPDKLRSSSIWLKHFGYLPVALKIEVVFHLPKILRSSSHFPKKLRSSSIYLKNWGRLPFAYKVEVVFQFGSY